MCSWGRTASPQGSTTRGLCALSVQSFVLYPLLFSPSSNFVYVPQGPPGAAGPAGIRGPKGLRVSPKPRTCSCVSVDTHHSAVVERAQPKPCAINRPCWRPRFAVIFSSPFQQTGRWKNSIDVKWKAHFLLCRDVHGWSSRVAFYFSVTFIDLIPHRKQEPNNDILQLIWPSSEMLPPNFNFKRNMKMLWNQIQWWKWNRPHERVLVVLSPFDFLVYFKSWT